MGGADGRHRDASKRRRQRHATAAKLSSAMRLAAQSCVLVHLNINPCVEYFGELNVTGQSEGPSHRLGPGIAGRLPFRGFFGIDLPGGIKYETAYVFGLNNRTERGALHARVEVELYAVRF